MHSERSDRRFAVGEDSSKGRRRGCDAGKRIEGRKRHIAVDTPVLLLAAIVHAADIQNRVAARAV